MSAPRFLRAEQWAVLKEQLKGKDNRNWLVSYLCQCVQDEIFRAYHSDDPLSKSSEVVQVVGLTLYTAIINKLKARLPAKDRDRDEATLVRWYPERTATLLEQALGFLKDEWSKDAVKNPSDNLATRWLRLRPRLAVLPNVRGRSIHGETAELFVLEVYTIVWELLEQLPPRRRSRTPEELEDRLEDRKKILTQITNSLQQGTAKGPIPPVVTENFVQGFRNNWTGIWSFPRSEIALEIALRASRSRTLASNEYLLNRLHELRRRAAALERLFSKSR
jgi:hypothetical protein